MTTFKDLLGSFGGRRVLVVGDLMLDDYVFGTATRISPEAPVMIIRQLRTQSVPGGAANVAKNIAALGGSATVVGVLGDDEAGRSLGESLTHLGGVRPVTYTDPARVTTRKTRIVADHAHQVLRIDSESTSILDAGAAKWLIDSVKTELAASDVVVLSDYQKGVLTDTTVQEIVRLAQERSVPVVANPKPATARSYKGAGPLISLNRAEATMLTGLTIEDERIAIDCLHQLGSSLGCKTVVVTLGEQGIAAISGGTVSRVTAPRVEVYDTAGAGDTVIATLALCCSVGADLEDSLRLAAETSARVVRHVGVAVPNERDLDEIRRL